MTTLTPLLAMQSTSWKIEALISDIGISKQPIIDPARLRDAVADPYAHAFSGDEKTAIANGLMASTKGAPQMFDGIHELAAFGKERAA